MRLPNEDAEASATDVARPGNVPIPRPTAASEDQKFFNDSLRTGISGLGGLVRKIKSDPESRNGLRLGTGKVPSDSQYRR